MRTAGSRPGAGTGHVQDPAAALARGALLHREDCGLYKSPFGYISADDAAAAMDELDVEACQVCLPDDALSLV
ncbi:MULTISPECIES: DUF6233 domain-containing protein [unclassified Streptomyces]|uniref:DUF6233 domain-containing protein n=1 Tax=unclassified Streptomyces TaxID=2593676 RepID=UPI000371F5A8|nr:MULTISPECIES: DUF6233 domain-containing protein [unclassified Streptomyces]MYS36814.1 hypothetical protein [Streptomyces sp. SID4920]MYX69285.1 hypothetical protein [Streptomyces sp. SID8373]